VGDKLYQTMRPVLAVGNGDMWLMSTPNGKRGFFHAEWKEGREQWERISATRRNARGSTPSFWTMSGRV